MDSADEHEDYGENVNAGAQFEQDKDPNLLYGPIEAQWVLNVLDDTLAKLNVCSYLTPAILNDKMLEAVDVELQVGLQEHFQIETEYLDLQHKLEVAEREEAEGIYDQRTEEHRAILTDVDKVLSDSTRAVCRLLTGETHNSIALKRLKELSTKRGPSVLEFIRTFQNLRQLVHAKLKTTAEEEKHTQEKNR